MRFFISPNNSAWSMPWSAQIATKVDIIVRCNIYINKLSDCVLFKQDFNTFNALVVCLKNRPNYLCFEGILRVFKIPIFTQVPSLKKSHIVNLLVAYEWVFKQTVLNSHFISFGKWCDCTFVVCLRTSCMLLPPNRKIVLFATFCHLLPIFAQTCWCSSIGYSK